MCVRPKEFHTGKFIFEIGTDVKITVFIQWKLWNFFGGEVVRSRDFKRQEGREKTGKQKGEDGKTERRRPPPVSVRGSIFLPSSPFLLDYQTLCPLKKIPLYKNSSCVLQPETVILSFSQENPNQ